MQYMVAVKPDARWIREAMLDGIVPDHVVALMTCESADALGLCRICDSGGARCHVLVNIGPRRYAKYCPVLWHDAFKPTSWRVEDLA